MGWLNTLRHLADYSTVDQLAPLRSPWSITELRRVVMSDLAGVQNLNPGRSEAMRVPAIVRGRALIAGLLSRHPLGVWETATAGKRIDMAPWLTATSTAQSPRQRNLWTFDDLIFSGLSLWFVVRDSHDAILDGIRVDPALWTVDPETREVTIQGIDNLSAEQVLLFEGPQEGLVTIARDTIAAAIALEAAWSKRVTQPIPMLELHSTDSTMDLDNAEAKALVDQWEKARREGGGTAYTPSSIETKIHGTAVTDLFVAGRNAIRLDIANFLSLPSALLEGSMSTASLTYSTKEGSRNDLVDLSLGYWSDAFEARLSQDDVVASGFNVAIDLSQLATATQPTRSPNQED